MNFNKIANILKALFSSLVLINEFQLKKKMVFGFYHMILVRFYYSLITRAERKK